MQKIKRAASPAQPRGHAHPTGPEEGSVGLPGEREKIIGRRSDARARRRERDPEQAPETDEDDPRGQRKIRRAVVIGGGRRGEPKGGHAVHHQEHPRARAFRSDGRPVERDMAEVGVHPAGAPDEEECGQRPLDGKLRKLHTFGTKRFAPRPGREGQRERDVEQGDLGNVGVTGEVGKEQQGAHEMRRHQQPSPGRIH